MEKLYFTIKSYELIIQYSLVLLFLGIGLTIFLFIMLSKFMIYLANRRNKTINYKIEDNESEIDSIKKRIKEIINSKKFRDNTKAMFDCFIWIGMSKEEIFDDITAEMYEIHFSQYEEEFKINENQELKEYIHQQIRGAIWIIL